MALGKKAVANKKNAPPQRDANLIPRSVLYSLFLQAPALICVLRGQDHRFDLVNPRYQKLFGTRPLLGLSIREALPELEGQGYFELLDRAYSTGEPFTAQEASVQLDRTGEGILQESFFHFTYQPMKTGQDEVEGIMIFAFEVTDQVVARREAAKLADELREANRAKDEFIAVISHELRTPMTSILGWARLLRLGGLDQETYQDALDSIERSTKAQAKLIEDLLDESRINAGKLRLDMRPVDLGTLCEAAIAMVRPAAEAKPIHLNVQIPSERIEASGDPMRLQQVISNVLSNAIKFTPEDGTVILLLKREGSEAVVVIRDSGRGVSPELLPHIFERYRQGVDRDGERQGGLGLGLAIARHLIEMHGGTIQAASDGEGKGSTFTIRFPVLRASTSAKAFVDRNSENRTGALPSLAGIRVLIIENEIDNRDMISAVMQRCGALVKCTSTAAEGFALVGTWKPDVIVSDIALPDEDGCSFLTRLRASDGASGRDTPALALTVLGRPEERARIRAAGFAVSRQKPIEPADLANEVARLVVR